MNHNAAFRVLGLASLLAVLASAGCSGPSLTAVQGKVTVGGRPLDGGNVTFYPMESGGPSHYIVGPIGPDGSYRMTTDGSSGVPKGKYKVTVNTVTQAPAAAGADPTKAAAPPSNRKANAKYESPDKTDLTVEVPSASYDLNLSP